MKSFFKRRVDGMMMKRLLAILILLLMLSSSGCISDGNDAAPYFTYFGPEDAEMTVSPYDTVSFSVAASDPDGDDLVTRWYVDDVFIEEGSELSYSFAAEGTYEVKAVIDDGDHDVSHSWLVEVEIDISILMEDVSSLRGLQFYEEVPFRRMTREELNEMLTEESNESEEGISDSEKVLRAFHAWEGDLSLKDELINLYTEGVEGFYDMTEKEFVLVDEDAKNPAVRMVTLAHELIHVLQDQNYDISPLLGTDNDDTYLALTSLLEGDATYFEIMYLYGMQDDALTDYFEYYSSLEDYDVEPIVEDMVLFPYIYGLQFVQELVGSYGVQYLDHIYENPPTSTEQIMHPDKYVSGEVPVDVLLPDVEGMTLIEENVLGEANLYIILDQRLSSKEAETASEGWNGDLYAYYEGDSKELLLFRSCWDDASDAVEFKDAYLTYIGTLSEEYATLEEGPGHIVLESASGAIGMRWEGDVVTIVSGNSTDLVMDYL